jgi:tripartite-type tricarboxylate transporter receptor subunit TctC
VIALGTSSARQTTLLADVPPIAATVPGFDALAWQGVVAPAGTPPDIVNKLNGELNRIINADDFRQQLTNFGMEPNTMSSGDFSALVRADVQRWATTVKTSGAKLD